MDPTQTTLESVLELYEQIFGAVFWLSVGAWSLTLILLAVLWLSPVLREFERNAARSTFLRSWRLW